jgi:multidrug efflux pump subunit AcrA (membrane-fusion protein)
MDTNKFLSQSLDNIPEQGNIKSFTKIYRIGQTRSGRVWFLGIFLLFLIFLFLPWTQNIRAKGNITTIKQEQRPQEINSVLAGKIVKWYVKEGDVVKLGDTILQLGEIKVDYFDPQLLQRTQQQIAAKQNSAAGYENKAATAQNQTAVLSNARALKQEAIANKIEQQKLKVDIDENDLAAIKNELAVYKRQLDAGTIMLDSGAISLIN